MQKLVMHKAFISNGDLNIFVVSPYFCFPCFESMITEESLTIHLFIYSFIYLFIYLFIYAIII